MNIKGKDSFKLFDKLSPRCTTPCWSEYTIRKMLEKAQYNLMEHFENFNIITKTKVPLLKCIEKSSRISVDITLTNGMNVYSSYLIRYCLEYKPRYRPTMLIIKKWASNIKIAGGLLIPSYGLVLMFLHFTQQYSQDQLPPLRDFLGKFSQTECWKIFDKVSYNYDILDILYNFFKYYSTFDFQHFSIDVSEGCKSYKVSRDSLLVYDPLSRLNVTRNVKQVVLDTFIKCCKEIQQMMKRAIDNGKTSGIISKILASDEVKIPNLQNYFRY